MYPEHDAIHAALPIRGVQMHLYYCFHCQAWRGSFTDYVQVADEDLRVSRDGRMDFGPFDSQAEVLTWAVRHLEIALSPPAVPGSLQGELAATDGDDVAESPRSTAPQAE